MEEASIKADHGLWLMPFRGISATKGLTPFDLVYLDEDYRVIQTIESFPHGAAEPLRELASSALVLAGHTVFSSQTQPGDQLVICIAEEMERRLAALHKQSTGSPCPRRTITSVSRTSPVPKAVPTPPSVDRTVEMQIAHQRLVEKETLDGSASERVVVYSLPALALYGSRASKRHPLPGLVAYYWTGGAPQAFHIADISSVGLYLLTDERWFPGTMILMTLQRTNTDGDDPDDFISVLTKVVRWGTDGVGLSFVPSNTVDLNSGEPLPETGVGKKALHRFIQRVQQPS